MRRGRQLLQHASPTAWVLGAMLLISVLLLTVNWLYQVARKPSELFFPVAGTLNKTPLETWRAYGPAFERSSTSLISPELLAALAQVEGSGNPVARTYWRWSYTPHPFSLYRPASSAVGMYQLTDGTFAAARHWCIRDHQVIAAGAWDDWHACWFNSLYARVIPSHAIELTAAYLDRAVSVILQRHHLSASTSKQQQELAAVIHLCGAGAAEVFASHQFRLSAKQRCGEHEVRAYVERVNTLASVFRRLAVSEEVR
ncbi:MAG: transglycosylase SLT domain-containing protein [Sinobacteraceae bacterium]|nr:transglycosylase SLT domain-containing protein [Nevskiaceae bacterium]